MNKESDLESEDDSKIYRDETEGEMYEDETKLCWDLHKAASKNNAGKCARLIDHFGAFVDCVDSNKNTPLHAAALKSFDACDVLLENGAKVNAQNKFRQTALHITESPKICELLILFGSDVNRKDMDKHTPLQLAAMRGNYKMCKILLEHGANAIDPKCYAATLKIHKLLTHQKTKDENHDLLSLF